MGTGCQTVIRRTTPEGLIEVEGNWKGGRTGIFREGKGYSGVARNSKGKEVLVGAYEGYAPLVAEVIKFFKTKQPPVSATETIELFAFMEAADESKRRKGKLVTLKEVLAKAEQE
jgi:hypothetical protein